MTIRFGCPLCRSTFEVPDQQGGTKVNCPKCGQKLLVPMAAPPPSPQNRTVLADNLSAPIPVGKLEPLKKPTVLADNFSAPVPVGKLEPSRRPQSPRRPAPPEVLDQPEVVEDAPPRRKEPAPPRHVKWGRIFKAVASVLSTLLALAFGGVMLVYLIKTWRDGPQTSVVTVVAAEKSDKAKPLIPATKGLVPLSANESDEARQQILQQINGLRAVALAVPTKRNAKLEAAAQKHAENMARKEMLEHDLDGKDPADRVKVEKYRYALVNENIAALSVKNTQGHMDLSTACEMAVVGWKKSEDHNRNLMNPAVTETGIGVARNSDGVWYFCQVFAKPSND
jgi:uncharacterized protein YkwD/DNA-directed RNA polymerase subunit RPC12/RpoP